MNDNQRMLARLSAFAIWAVVAASLMFWALRLFTTAPAAPAYTVSALDGTGLRGDLARVFGSTPVVTAAAETPPVQASRFKLVGVAAPRDAGVQGGLALISVDGKPARAITVGRTIDDGWVLQSVNRRGARLSSNLGANTLDLEMPALALASRGSLPPVSNTIVNSEGGGLTPGNAPGAPSPPIVPLPFPGLPAQTGVPGAPMPSAGPAAGLGGAAPGVGADGRVLSNPVVIPPAAVPPGGQAGPPAIYVPPEELPRTPTRRAPRVNGVGDPAAVAPAASATQ